MKKILGYSCTIAAALVFSSTAMAEFDTSKLSVGAGYGFGNDGVLSLRADYDISDNVDHPVKVRIGYDRYSLDGWGGNYSWSYSTFYGGAYYDFNEILGIDDKIHPFAGLGFGFGSASCSGGFCSGLSSPTVGGLYYIGGIQYDITEQFSAEASFSVWGGLSIGANYNF